MTTITVEVLMSYGPCKWYPRERVVELCGGREALTAQQIADLEIPAQDRIWTLCHVLARLDRASLVAFARGRAERAKESADAASADAYAYAAASAARAAYAYAYASDAADAAADDATRAADAARAAAAYAAYASDASRKEAIADLVARITAA